MKLTAHRWLVIASCVLATAGCTQLNHAEPRPAPDAGGSTGSQDARARNHDDAAPPSGAPTSSRDGATSTSSDTGIARAHDAAAGDDAAAPDAAAHGQVDSGIDSGPPPIEDCGNGLDDDANGLADCNDPACNGWTCVPPAPDDWSGPGVLLAGAPPIAACAGGYDVTELRAGDGVSAAAATCSACSCSPQTAACATKLEYQVRTDCFGAFQCSGSVGTAPACWLWSVSCLAGQTEGMLYNALPNGTPECTPSESTPTLPPARWDVEALVCTSATARSSAGCASDRLCVPPASSGGQLCVVREGDQSCPVFDYTDRHVYYRTIDDGRACAACTCDHDCTYAWNIYLASDTTCSSPKATITQPGYCTAATLEGGNVRLHSEISGSGACTPGGGEPIGSATAADPITVCCLQ